MRLLLATALVLLFLWLLKAERSSHNGNACEAASLSGAVVSLLLSPLSLYSWLTSTLLRLMASLPALVLGALHHSVLLPLAALWCAASICSSLLLTCLYVALYLLHLALVFGAVAILTLAPHKMADGDAFTQMKPKEKLLPTQREGSRAKSRPRAAGRRAAQQG
ncbi:unnamed protein product [Menidia menidia]|uniref:(Atlantic silverside) hypothetical protein n=1 Tax=Menidia menidia TaxID=238744 RepID=A0A8S4BCX4_9TELE|nr:unnamed protein product [Menidia menidia]